jgi:hypothetical protein
MKRLFIIILLFSGRLQAQDLREGIQRETWAITEVMFHDVVNPPAAARYYAYSLLAGYETLSGLTDTLPLFQRSFADYPSFTSHDKPETINQQLAVLYSILETARLLLPSGYLLEGKQQALLNSFSQLPEPVKTASIGYGRSIAQKMVQYSKTDGYFKLSTLSRYKPISGEAYWQPTAPEYMAAVEPNWRTIRGFFIDSASVHIKGAITAFDKSKTSDFYKLANEVYTTSRQLSAEQKRIANFWDCNPFAVQFEGHMSVGLKKISPGGHWMGITGIAAKKAGLDFAHTLLIHTLVALTLHDAFICCWTEKYQYNRVRPETVINRYIDEKWQPLLQTPPFPEFPSGHSVISTAASEILANYLGDHFSFTDSVENYLGLPSRSFQSFGEAAAEARISRLYGGIHFRDAIEQGAIEGEALGKMVLSRLGKEKK